MKNKLPSAQQGSVLLISLVFLLLLTIAGASAIRLVNIDTQAIGANIERNYVYQAAEAGLIKAEQQVHQSLANFNNIRFYRADETIDANCEAQTLPDGTVEPASLQCFKESQCIESLCMAGRYDRDVKNALLAATVTYEAPASYLYPIGYSPNDIPGANDSERTTYMVNQILTNRIAQPWRDNSIWEQAKTVSAAITIPNASGFETTEIAVKYLIEFRGFNLASEPTGFMPPTTYAGMTYAQIARQPENLPPSEYWMMSYRVTVRLDETSVPDSYEGSRVMLQGLYNRHLPRSLPAVVGVRNRLITTRGLSTSAGFSDIFVDFGCTPEGDITQPSCLFDAGMPPVASNSFKTGDRPTAPFTPIQINGYTSVHVDIQDSNPQTIGNAFRRNATDNSVNDNARDIPMISKEDYFTLYFGDSKTAVLSKALDTDDKTVALIDVSTLSTGDCVASSGSYSATEISNADVIVYDGTIDILTTEHPFAQCTFKQGSKIFVTGNLNQRANLLANSMPSAPGLIYVGGKASWSITDGVLSEAKLTHTVNGVSESQPSMLAGSNQFYSMLAFEEDLSVDNSMSVAPANPPTGYINASSLNQRSRYAWIERAFDD